MMPDQKTDQPNGLNHSATQTDREQTLKVASSRRKLLRYGVSTAAVAAAVQSPWSRPIVDAVLLPAHAATSEVPPIEAAIDVAARQIEMSCSATPNELALTVYQAIGTKSNNTIEVLGNYRDPISISDDGKSYTGTRPYPDPYYTMTEAQFIASYQSVLDASAQCRGEIGISERYVQFSVTCSTGVSGGPSVTVHQRYVTENGGAERFDGNYKNASANDPWDQPDFSMSEQEFRAKWQPIMDADAQCSVAACEATLELTHPGGASQRGVEFGPDRLIIEFPLRLAPGSGDVSNLRGRVISQDPYSDGWYEFVGAIPDLTQNSPSTFVQLRFKVEDISDEECRRSATEVEAKPLIAIEITGDCATDSRITTSVMLDGIGANCTYIKSQLP